MKSRLTPELQGLSVLLGLGTIALLTLNFTLRHELAAGSSFRFLVSGSLLGLTALFFRFALAQPRELHRVAYRLATTFTFWAFAYALFPNYLPRIFLYLLIVPAIFFLYRIEVKAALGRVLDEDLLAAGIILAMGGVLYFEQQPMQVVLFPDSAFDWQDYYRNAPVMGIVGLGLIRLNKEARWVGLSALGAFFVLCAAVLTATFLTADIPGFPVPTEFLYVVGLAHLALAFLFIPNPGVAYFYRFAGIDEEQRERFSRQIYWLVVGALHLAIPMIFFLSVAEPLALAVVVLAILGTLYHYLRRSISVVLVEISVLTFPVAALVYPELDSTFLSLALLLPLLACVLLRHWFRFSTAIPNWTYILCAMVFASCVVYRGLFSPTGLALSGLLVASWLTLPDRPVEPSPRIYHLYWPPAVALTLLCLNRGYGSFLLPLWAVASVGPPLLFYSVAGSKPLRVLSQRYGWTALHNWLGVAPQGLVQLSFVALGIAAVSFVVDFAASASNWTYLGLIGATLALNCGLHFAQALRNQSLISVFLTEAHLWLILGLLRFKLELLGRIELGTPLDAYLLLGFGFLVAGLREVIRRRTRVFEGYLARSSLVYGLLGWGWALWLQFTAQAGFHAESGSILLAALYYWFSLTRKKANVIPAFVFLNIASVLFFFRLEFHNPQFYILPTVASILTLTHLFKDQISVHRMRMIRLFSSLALVGASSFYNVVDFNESLYFPLSAALVAALGVVVGIGLRVRIFLYAGFSSFILNSLAALVHVIRNQPPSQTKLIIGVLFLVIGLIFTGSFLLFQVKRQEILNQYARLLTELKGWE